MATKELRPVNKYRAAMTNIFYLAGGVIGLSGLMMGGVLMLFYAAGVGDEGVAWRALASVMGAFLGSFGAWIVAWAYDPQRAE